MSEKKGTSYLKAEMRCTGCGAYQPRTDYTINGHSRCLDPNCRGKDGLRSITKESEFANRE